MDDLAKLLATEEIRLLKARYWRGVDLQDRALLRSVFADDALIPSQDGALTRDPDAFVENVLANFAGGASSHLGGSLELTFVSETEAHGIWAMEDRIWAGEGNHRLPFKTLHGWGHYHDVYRRTPEGWRIHSFELKRTRVETT